MEMKKGFIFTMDAIMAISILIIILIVSSVVKFETIIPEKRYERLNYIAEDTMDILNYLKGYEIRNMPTMKRLIENGILTERDLNKTVLDLIGSFWYMENFTIAENISREVLEGINYNICINLTIGDSNIYSSCDGTPDDIAVGTRLESGYEPGKPKYGYISRAWATKYKKNTTEVIPFYPEGSGWNGQNLHVFKRFQLPNGVTIYNGTLYVSIHYGGSKSFPEFMILKVNDGENVKNEITWIYRQQVSSEYESSSAAYGYVDITEGLLTGNNKIELKIGSPQYNAHFHPGMKVVVTYSLEQEMREGEQDFNKTHYFDDVTGRPGAWATMSFSLPPDSTNKDVYIRIHTKDVDATGVTHYAYGKDHYDVEIYLNSEDPIFNESNPNSEDVYEFNMSDIEDYLVNGTNVLSVYLNCYGDVKWGSQTAQIYSDMFSDPTGSSYVNFSYSISEPLFKYGEIDIGKTQEFGINGTDIIYNFTLSAEESDIIESHTHLVQGFSSMLEEFAWHEGDTQNLVFKSPSPRATPSKIYITPAIWNEGNNSIRMRDFQPDGSTSPYNYILPWTSLEYKYLVSGMVGYGDVFNTSQEAVQDAHDRLSQKLGNIDIISSKISMENVTIRGIEWLWGPSLFKTIVWEE